MSRGGLQRNRSLPMSHANPQSRLQKKKLEAYSTSKKIFIQWASAIFRSPCMSSKYSNQRLAAFKKQSGRCYYCRSLMWLRNIKNFALEHNISESEAERFQCTAEHLLARCDGGKNSSENIVAACFFCNSTRHKSKKPLVPHEYKSHIQKRIKKDKWHPRKFRNLWSLRM
jgi:5-methylcytosine-specific restriction endonuclease McrA